LECLIVHFSRIFKGLQSSNPQNRKGSHWFSIGSLAREKWPLERITNGQPVKFEYFGLAAAAQLMAKRFKRDGPSPVGAKLRQHRRRETVAGSGKAFPCPVICLKFTTLIRHLF
jgi:hypothetical protein